MRNKKKVIALITITLFSAILCGKPVDFLKKKNKNLATKALFLQSRFQRIELPPSDTLEAFNGQHIVTEQVTYNHADNSLTEKKNMTIGNGKINEMQHLNEVVVEAKSRFVPEHNGRVDVDFVIKVPKELLSPKYRLILIPKLLHNDSLVDLETITVRGAEFKTAQMNDSLKYDEYLNSIIAPSKYDSAFLDYTAVRKNILKYQTMIYDKYTDDWNRHKEYLEMMQYYIDKQTKLDISNRTYVAKKNADFGKEVFDKKIENRLDNRDTTGIYNELLVKYNKEMEKRKRKYEKENNKLFDKQLSYRTTGFPLQDTPHTNFTFQDSVNLSKFYYDFGKMTENEVKAERRAAVYEVMTRFGEVENIRLDTIVDQGRDFVYYYKQQYPVTPRLRKIRIFMDAKVEAVDQSGYYSPGVDTLSYFIASLAQLADTSLYKVSKLNREAYSNVTAFLKYPSGKNSILDVNYSDNKNQMLSTELFLDAVKKNKLYAVDSVVVVVSRSLNGTFDANAKISTDQAHAVQQYLKNLYKDTDFANRFVAAPKGEDWNELVEEIKSNDKIVHKENILNMLANAKFPDDCKKEIKNKYKADYAIIENEIYPYMNKTDISFYVHRTDMTDDKEVRSEYKGDPYAKGVKLLQEREYWKALQLLAEYGDYNTALCLVCLGYNGKAYELLGKLKETAETDYLLAIVANRLNKKAEAIEYLKKSIKLDPSKRYRIGLDAEAKEIASQNKLE